MGIHYARAWSKAGANVCVYDLSDSAIHRFPLIWAERYGGPVPESVEIRSLDKFSGSDLEFDLVVIGTPPPSHGELARLSLDSRVSEFVAIQKPVCTPQVDDLSNMIYIEEQASALGVTLISGYNHRYSPSFREFLSFVGGKKDAASQRSIEVNWLESWDGILLAHPWLKSPSDSYLGHSRLGGGALFEHSHGLDLGLFLWTYFGGLGLEAFDVNSVWSESGSYDISTYLSALSSGRRLSLTVTQDVVTAPVEKSVQVHSEHWAARLEFSSSADVLYLSDSQGDNKKVFAKNRESDFDSEVALVRKLIEGDQELSEESKALLDFGFALDTSIFAAAAMHRGQFNQAESQEHLQTWLQRVKRRVAQ